MDKKTLTDRLAQLHAEPYTSRVAQEIGWINRRIQPNGRPAEFIKRKIRD